MSQMWVAPFLASLPPWWRLLQCFRRYRDSNETVHLLNAAKYTSSIMAAIVTGLRRIYRKLNLHELTIEQLADFFFFFFFFFYIIISKYDSTLAYYLYNQFNIYIYLGYQDGLGINATK
jgi:hypothetical protein